MAENSAELPTRDEAVARWEQLAREIAAAPRPKVEGPGQGAAQGELIVMGSGITSMDFLLDARHQLEAADVVFYCVSDPVTQVWLRRLRPDAYDLYVFYDENKRRYHTYMQMSEAMLHPVRQGKRVLAIYYGHPGVFVLSTHRSIKIARREGHRALMRPGISALDCLCADVGFDPAYPGLVTYEASDMLLRNRRIDTSLHVVLWQVGVVGEMGYRRRGFLNDKFGFLVDVLEEAYGPDWVVTHYIASRYVTFEPTIQRFRIKDLRHPKVRALINGISTFYIEPQVAVATDMDRAVALGLAKPGSRAAKPVRMRQIANYGADELAAIDGLADFKVPAQYQHQTATAAADFMIALSNEPELQDLYRRDPAAALADPRFAGLDERARRQLASRHEWGVQAAVKGSVVEVSAAEAFVLALYARPALARGLLDEVRRPAPEQEGWTGVDAWIRGQSHDTRMSELPSAISAVNAMSLAAWTGAYVDAQGRARVVIEADRAGSTGAAYVDGAEIKGFTFNNTGLGWSAADGNRTNGVLAFELPAPGEPYQRRVSGSVWQDGAPQPDSPTLEAMETLDPPIDDDGAASLDAGRAAMANFVSRLLNRTISLNGVAQADEEIRAAVEQSPDPMAAGPSGADANRQGRGPDARPGEAGHLNQPSIT